MRNLQYPATCGGDFLFSLLTVCTPLAGLAVVAVSVNTGLRLIVSGENVFLCGGLFGTLILLFNISIFYLYIKLSVAHER